MTVSRSLTVFVLLCAALGLAKHCCQCHSASAKRVEAKLEFNLDERKVEFWVAAETVIPATVENDMGIVLRSAFGQGFLTRRADDEVRVNPIWLAETCQQQLLAYYDLLDQAGMPAFEMCLRFVLSNPAVSTVPIGCETADHLEAIVAAASKGALPEDIINRLDEIAAMVPRRPYEEPMILPFGKDYFGPGIANMGAVVQVGKLKLEVQ